MMSSCLSSLLEFLILQTSAIAFRYEALTSPGRKFLEELLRDQAGHFAFAAQTFQILSGVRDVQADVVDLIQYSDDALRKWQM